MVWKRESDTEELEAAFWDMRGVESVTVTQRTDQLCFMGKMIVNSKGVEQVLPHQALNEDLYIGGRRRDVVTVSILA